MLECDAPLISNDLQYNWHPCAQMKDYENFPPLVIRRAYGSYIELTNGSRLIDATASWWCKSLGHNHPRLKAALQRQLNRFEHVMFAHTTHEVMAQLGKKLADLTPSLKKVFYAGDGSCAVEIALKMSLHARLHTGESQRKHFIALKNSYHGETAGALSVSDVGLYREPYQALLFPATFIGNIPYVTGVDDPTWSDCSAAWQHIEKALMPYANTATAIIVEPILQGAGGMQIYSQDLLKRLRQWSLQHNVHLIADEIMTGLYRTGKRLACEHANIEPDFLCLSKGLTSGWLPFSVVLTRDNIYDLFYADYRDGKAFLHSHTYSGNALAASVALEVLTMIEDSSLSQHIHQLSRTMLEEMRHLAHVTQKLTNVRGIGAMVAADVIPDAARSRLGFEIYQKSSRLGALLRPLGNTIYWTPPLNTPIATIKELSEIVKQVLNEL